jgi:hypothetical protein
VTLHRIHQVAKVATDGEGNLKAPFLRVVACPTMTDVRMALAQPTSSYGEYVYKHVLQWSVTSLSRSSAALEGYKLAQVRGER